MILSPFVPPPPVKPIHAELGGSVVVFCPVAKLSTSEQIPAKGRRKSRPLVRERRRRLTGAIREHDGTQPRVPHGHWKTKPTRSVR